MSHYVALTFLELPTWTRLGVWWGARDTTQISVCHYILSVGEL